MSKLELRFKPVDLTTTEKDDELKVEGYVNLTEETSEVLSTYSGHKFVEKISKGAFSKALQRATEIDFLVEHDKEKILSTTRNNSLNLVEDDKGLFMSATISPTTWGKDYYTLVKDGIIRNFSFGFKALTDDWSERHDGLLERTVYDLDLFEVSLVKNPAYTQSYVEARGSDYMTTDEVLERGERMSVVEKENTEITEEDKDEIQNDVINSEDELKRLADSFDELIQTLKEKQILLDESLEDEEEDEDDEEETEVEEEEERALPEDVQEDEEEKDEESLKSTILGLEMKIEKIYSMLEEVLADKNEDIDKEDEEEDEEIKDEKEKEKQAKKDKESEEKPEPSNLQQLKETLAGLNEYED